MVTLGILFALGLPRFAAPYPSFTDCVNDPVSCDNRIVMEGMDVYVSEVTPDGFRITKQGHSIWVRGATKNLAVGDKINLRAIFHKEWYMDMEALYVSKLRRVRVWLSIPPVLIVGGLFLWCYRVDWHRLVLVRRK